jgi:hypothetical protein
MKKILLTIITIICFAFTAQPQILNGSFENWTAGIPDNWWGAVIPPYNTLSQTTDAHSGTYAAELHVDNLAGSAFGTPLSTGDGVNTTTHPLTFVPLSISFWYKLTSVGGDELACSVLVYSGGAGVGFATPYVPAAANYTHASAAIFYGVVPSTADSIALIFLIANTSGTPHIGSDATIDEVSISPILGINNPPVSNFQITPNPANESIYVELPSTVNEPSELIITDLGGRMVYNSTVSNKEQKFNISTAGLKQGTYYFTLKSGDLEKKKTLVIVHE